MENRLNRLFVSLTGAAALFVMLFALLAPAPAKLPYDNRAPSRFSWRDPDAYFFDRLPHRTALLKLCRNLEFALGKNEYGGAFRGKNGYIFSNENTDEAVLARNLAALAAFAEVADVPLCTALVPSKTDALPGLLPPLYAAERDALWETAKTAPGAVDLLPTLRMRGGEGKYIYYRGDHHLTSLGAYYVCRALAAPLGMRAAEAADFSVSVVRADFAGSDARRLLTDTGDDRIALFRARGDSAVTVTADGSARRGLYDFDALAGDDAYGVFPGYGAGYTQIAHGEGRARILLLCDSYGCALAPFLAQQYDVDMLDLRYSGMDASALCRTRGYTAVLCCYGIDTLAAHEILFRLQR